MACQTLSDPPPIQSDGYPRSTYAVSSPASTIAWVDSLMASMATRASSRQRSWRLSAVKSHGTHQAPVFSACRCSVLATFSTISLTLNRSPTHVQDESSAAGVRLSCDFAGNPICGEAFIARLHITRPLPAKVWTTEAAPRSRRGSPLGSTERRFCFRFMALPGFPHVAQQSSCPRSGESRVNRGGHGGGLPGYFVVTSRIGIYK